MRQEIDGVDSQILGLLARRNKVVGRIAILKSELGLEPVQPDRYQQMIENLQTQAEELGVSPALVGKVWGVIHEESVAQQISLSKSGQ